MSKPKSTSLAEHVEILSGFAFKSKQFSEDDGDMPIVRIRDVTRGYSETYYSGEYDEKYVVENGDLLIGMDGEFNRERWAGGPALLNQRVCKIDSSTDELDPQYLYHFLPLALKRIEDDTPFVTVKHLSVKKIQKIKIPLPPLDEQKRIAEVLDRAEALRARRRAALALLDELTQSIFLDMFGDPVFNPHGFARKPLSDACASKDDIKCGPFGTQLNKSEFREEGIPLWGIKNVNRNFELPAFEFLEPHTAKRLSQYSIVAGDIVMTRKGTVGNCAVYPETFPQGIMHSDLLRLRVDTEKCSPAFLSHQLHCSRDVERQLALLSGGAVMPGINVTRLKKLEVLVPPIALQREFEARLGKVGEIASSVKDGLSGLDELFASIQSRAFKGELFGCSREPVAAD